MTTEFILASASPRRKELLERIGATFRILPADVVEFEDPDGDPEDLVRRNALLKADWIAERYGEDFVLGSDTTVHLEGRVLGKPRNMDKAREMLLSLGERTHAVYTAVAFVNRGLGLSEVFGIRSEVTFRELDLAAVEKYFEIVNPLDKAGSYGIQEGSEIIIDSFSGSHSNIMGLPLEETKELLMRHSLL